MTDDSIKQFILNNFPSELISGLEHDDPQAIDRALRMLQLPPVKARDSTQGNPRSKDGVSSDSQIDIQKTDKNQ